jgi:flagellum-specific peptidoglycan hydrolase FlgJ
VLAAQEAMHATGCWASVTLAQFALESNFGKQIPFNSHNYFGIKHTAGSQFPFVTCQTKEFYLGGFHAVEAEFVQYPSDEICFVEHAKLLTNPKGPYSHCLPYIHDLFKWTQRICPIYATDKSYYQKIMQLIEDWHLRDFDLPPS